MMAEKKIVVRMAPSPTGPMHIGTARTALFNFLFARQNNGKFILRIEDTDKERSKKEYERGIIDGLKWLGLEWDEMYKQSERTEIYKKYLEQLISEGKAYISKETAKEGKGEVEVVRFKNPGKQITFFDVVRGEITFDTAELKDFVIAKNVGEPLYHFAVVVDDMEMNVTHIVRGEDHLSNTPRQILIQEALRADRPIYVHLPLILAPDKSKLSKRKHGETVSVEHYKNEGFFPEAVINFLALLGWNPGTVQEIFTLKELVEQFSLEKLQKSGAAFNLEKLLWLNKEYLKRDKGSVFLVEAELKKFGLDGVSDEILTKLSPFILERISVLSDVRKLFDNGELSYFFSKPEVGATSLLWKGEGDVVDTFRTLEALTALLDEIPKEDFSVENIKSKIMLFAEKEGRGRVLWPMRFALSGREKSPDPFTLAYILGKSETIARLKNASN
ncbi:MAG: glutamate--tRNA ligase [bacterium]|nr:glutamate--tRNA ligase [bacterium]